MVKNNSHVFLCSQLTLSVTFGPFLASSLTANATRPANKISFLNILVRMPFCDEERRMNDSMTTIKLEWTFALFSDESGAATRRKMTNAFAGRLNTSTDWEPAFLLRFVHFERRYKYFFFLIYLTSVIYEH